MTPIQMNGKNRLFFIILITTLFTMCTRFNTELYSGNDHTYIYTYYLNDSINFSVKLAGDNVQVKNKKELVSVLKKHKIKKFKKNTLEYFKTNGAPYYELILLKFDQKKLMENFF